MINNNETQQSADLPEKLVQRFLDNQAQELQIRAQEVDLRKQADSHNFQYANSALENRLNI